MIPKSEYDLLNEKTMKLVNKYKQAEKELKELREQNNGGNNSNMKTLEEYEEVENKYQTLNDKV